MSIKLPLLIWNKPNNSDENDFCCANKTKITKVLSLFLGAIITLSTVSGLTGCSSGNKPLTSNNQEKDSLIKAEKHHSEEAETLALHDASSVRRALNTMALEQKRDRSIQGFSKPLLIQNDYSHNTENYFHNPENEVMSVAQHPVSTFSIDVDTGSYSNTRRMLTQGQLPPGDAIRLEELVNYFDYTYTTPDSGEQPFSVTNNLSVSPWNSERHLLRVALKGYQGSETSSKGSNLVFLLDVSGSMNQANKLPLLKRSLTMLTQQLSEKDKVSIVVYAGASGLVLAPTAGNKISEIAIALNQLSAGGSTNGGAGIELAYLVAQQEFIAGGVNRVILATDGDFNVGTVNHQQLIELIKHKKEQGIALTTLGFGQGNYNDHLMEQLADAGNGNYAYIDTINEARKVLVDELNANMQIIAKDVKIQIEFNPANVAEYRLIGYENRKLAQQDFNNDKVDAGDIGAGHKVTAFYELTLQDSKNKYSDPLRYQGENLSKTAKNDELALIKLRYKKPESDTSELLSQVVIKQQIDSFANQSDDFRFATAVLGFGQLLKQSKYVQNIDFEQVLKMANSAKGKDDFGYRGEFIQLVRSAQMLVPKGSQDQPQKLSSNSKQLSNEEIKLTDLTTQKSRFLMVNKPHETRLEIIN